MQKTKVVILHNIMAPYRYPLFREISRVKNIDLVVYFMSEQAKNRKWKKENYATGFKYKILPNFQLNFFGKDLLTYIVNYTFPIDFFRNKFDVLISAGWLDFSSQVAFFLCKISGRKFILWSESTKNEPSWRRTVTLPLVKLFVKHADACIAIGSLSKDYLISIGANPSKIFIAYSTVNVNQFIKGNKNMTKNKNALRKKYHITTKYIILYVGQFIERKGLKYLINAYQKLTKKKNLVSLVLLGYGPQKDELENLINSKSIPNVFFLKHVEINDLIAVYCMSDIFVLPSLEDTWGLVINEAMACGLPVIVSEKAGSSADLVIDGLNGYKVKPKSTTDLYNKLKLLLDNPSKIKAYSKKSQEYILNFTPKIASKSFIKAIEFVK